MGVARAGPPGMAPGRKPEGVWSAGGRNGWDEVGGGPGGAGWGEEPGTAPWATKQKGPGGGLWDTASELDWGHKPPQKPQLTKEQVWNSKQFRMLVDLGYKVSVFNNNFFFFGQCREWQYCLYIERGKLLSSVTSVKGLHQTYFLNRSKIEIADVALYQVKSRQKSLYLKM